MASRSGIWGTEEKKSRSKIDEVSKNNEVLDMKYHLNL